MIFTLHSFFSFSFFSILKLIQNNVETGQNLFENAKKYLFLEN